MTIAKSIARSIAQSIASPITGAIGNLYGDDMALEFNIASPSETLTIPAHNTGVYSATIDWGDDSTSEITAYNDADLAHTYTDAGTYTVRISGLFPRLYFNNGGDKLKLTSILNWGSVGSSSTQDRAFYGCSNLVSVAVSPEHTFFSDTLLSSYLMFRSCSLTELPSAMTLDLVTDARNMFEFNSLASLPDGMSLGALSNGGRMFYDCDLTSLPSGIGLSAITNGDRMFELNSLTSLPGGLVLGSLGNGERMFYGNSITSVPSSVTFASLTSGVNMFSGSTIATDDYSTLLVNIEANNSNNGVTFHGGNSTYNAAGGVARAALIADHTWIITDGGAA